ncbi:hypothetical protein [Streptomyces sp. NPDC057280]|uniref:hypothetical protein n=1 Tax=Streptomyces sp. NPDC057280 TaxID=3346081 RepID=UPI00363B0419
MTETNAERDPLDITREAIPGFRAVQAADAALQQRLKELRSGSGAQPVDLGADAFAALISGKPVPDDLGRRAWEAQQAGEFRAAELQILTGIERRLQNHGENTVKAGADEGLRALRPVLDELLDQARPMVAALHGVHDAQGAIDRGPDAVAAWSGMAAIVTRYKAIRDAQKTVARMAIGESLGTKFGSVGFASVFNVWSEIENVAELWPEWTPGGDSTVRPPWPVVYQQRPFEVRHDREWVMWLLSTPQVRLWVPTIGELKKAWTTQREDAAARGDAGDSERVEHRGKRPVRVRGGDGSEWSEYRSA